VLKKIKPLKLIVLFTSCLIIFGAWRFFTHTDAPAAAMVAVAKGSIDDTATATGAIVPRQTINIKSQIPGIVDKILRDEGQFIAAGEKLIEIRPEPTPKQFVEAKQELETKRLAETNRRKAFERIKKVWQQKLVSDMEYEGAREAYDQSVLDTNLARDKLNLLQTGKTSTKEGVAVENIISSPADGYVLKRHVAEGDPVVPINDMQAGTEILTIADMKDLVFKGIIDEIDIGRIKPGMQAEIHLGALPDKVIRGKISAIGLQASNFDEKLLLEGKAAPEMKFKIEISDLDAKDIESLRSGYSATAKINVRSVKEVLTLPERVIEWKNEKPYVMVWNAKKKGFEEQAITIGISDGITAEISSGLQEGMQVKDMLASTQATQ
jgi:HlyD family secretion protein